RYANMSHRRLTVVSIGLLLANTPVWTTSITNILGFPAWAFAVFLSSVVYAAVIAYLLNHVWPDESDGTP
ncbi:hypothetical protein MK139_08490, partial [bacterium]|nr:hypothetical protein [bacterium]